MITGANGFIGRHLAARLAREGRALTLAHRSEVAGIAAPSVRSLSVGDVGPGTDWRRALEGCATVVHLAGQLPRRQVGADDFRSVNDAGTARLAEQALDAGVTRFVLLSSVAAIVGNDAACVVDERTPPTRSPTPYGASKRAAERHVAQFAGQGRVGISIRPPLVYAADARGRWRTLQRLAATGLPLPFGAIRNRRSLIAVENLVDALLAALAAQAKDVSGVYFVADDRSVSLGEIFTWLREGMGKRPRLLPVPTATLRGALRLLGLGGLGQSLLGDLEFDSSLFRRTFDWRPRLDSGDAIKSSGAAYRQAALDRALARSE